jgi:DNA-binding transcriptional regulator YbjK
MARRRDQALEAALELLGTNGVHGLTHRAVDTRAGLPPGTTSNYFRTRDALLRGALDHLTGLERARLEAMAVPTPADHSAGQIARDAAEMFGYLLGPARTLTLARHALFLEAARRPELRALLTTATKPYWRLLEHRLRAAGSIDPLGHARLLLACIDGLLVDQLLRPTTDFSPERAVRTLLDGMICVGEQAQADRDTVP